MTRGTRKARRVEEERRERSRRARDIVEERRVAEWSVATLTRAHNLIKGQLLYETGAAMTSEATNRCRGMRCR